MAQLSKLKKIAVAGFAACCTSYFLFQYTLSKTLIDSNYVKDAMELVKNHQGAKFYLGEPIEPKFAKINDYERDPPKTTLQVSVSGPKSKGELFLTVNRIDENQLELDSVLLQIGKDDSKRLEIKSQVASAS